MKERQEKQYPCYDSNVPGMLDDLLQANFIELLEMKCPEEANRVNNPKYCRYHQLSSHSIQRCFVLKDKIMKLRTRGEVSFNDKVATLNMATIGRINPHIGLPIMMLKLRSFEFKS